jgi:hypothetical protein
MRNNRLLQLVSLVPLLTSAACTGWNSVETGARGALTFTPDECGRDNCDLYDTLAVGGSSLVRIEAVDDNRGVGGLTLISANPAIVDVYFVDQGAFSSDWEIVGNNAGWADLIVIDPYGYEVDHITIEVGWVDYLELDHGRGNAVGPTQDVPGFDEIWYVNAYETVSFDANPVRIGGYLMGRLSYGVVIDEALANALDADARLQEGHLSFAAPAGEYAVDFMAPDGATLYVLFVVQ